MQKVFHYLITVSTNLSNIGIEAMFIREIELPVFKSMILCYYLVSMIGITFAFSRPIADNEVSTTNVIDE